MENAVGSSGEVEMVEKPAEIGKLGTLIVRVGAATVVKIPALVDSRETPVGPVEAESALGDCKHCLTDRDSIGTGCFLFLFGMPPFLPEPPENPADAIAVRLGEQYVLWHVRDFH